MINQSSKKSNKYVCIECMEQVDCLFVEFNKGNGNIKLTRCQRCGHVADKYIEYELILVLIDVVLHRKPAFRHLFYNRDAPISINQLRSVQFLIFTAIFADVALKTIILNTSRLFSHKLSGFMEFLSLILLCTLEHSTFIMIMFAMLYIKPIPRLNQSSKVNMNRIVYISIAFPEILKYGTCMLQIFETEPIVLFLCGGLITSIQYISLQSVTNLNSSRILLGTIFALILRVYIRTYFFNLQEIWTLGII